MTKSVVYCSPEQAPLFLDWIRTREGIAHWSTINLSNPGQSWSAPVVSKEGARLARPHTYAQTEPDFIVTSTDDVVVTQGKEVKRFHVGLERHGMAYKLTDGGSRRVRAAVEKAGDRAWYEFHGQDAVIMVPDFEQTLTEYAKEHKL